MIIGFDGSRVFVPDRTGTENYSFQLLKNLAEIDGSNLGKGSLSKNKYRIYIRPGINVGKNWPDNFQFIKINWPRLWTQGGLGLQTFKDNLDVLFIPAHTLPLFRKPGLKTVVTVHDLGSEYLPSMHQAKQRIYLGFMQEYQLQTATKIIAVSRATKGDLVKKIGLDPNKIEVVYEGYDKKMFNPVKTDILNHSLKQYGLKPKEYFLFIGTVQPRKNLERLIRAFSSDFTGLKLAIVGSKGWMSDRIYSLPEELKTEDRVRFLGYVPEKDLPALYSGAKAFTFPSLFEGFGLPILEAQACGCPVLTSNISSMPEVAGKGAVFVNPYSVDDIVKGMIRIMNNDLRIKNIKAGFENVKRFSWEKAAKETLEVLEKI